MSSKRIVSRNGPTYSSLLEYYRSHARAANLQIEVNNAMVTGASPVDIDRLQEALAEAKARYVRALQKVVKEDDDYRERTYYSTKAASEKGTKRGR